MAGVVSEVVAGPVAGVFRSWLGRAVEIGIDGVGPFRGAVALAAPLVRRGVPAEQVIDRLTMTQSGHAALQGAVTSVGGIATAALGAPVGLAAALMVQARLAAAIAHVYGHDLADSDVRAAVGECVWGTTETTTARSSGVTAGTKAAGVILPRVQAAAARRSAARLAAGKSAGAIASRVASSSATKIVPVVGAVIGGAFDLISTRRVAKRAKTRFGTLVLSDTGSCGAGDPSPRRTRAGGGRRATGCGW
ncbi:EcsC family protein [Fodinicola acaciae]|uniref:EcsC family protein n=1 Tax=Fodinicola acaciae TaxID=2681555 RepID=UPI0013D28EB0|nr:EcsC family protein [Fodinicola acaciae]